MNESVTIVGAGIGGLATALALKQNGITATVYESAPEIKPVGAGIVMAGNAMQVFREMGISKRIEEAGNRVSLMKITDERLNVLSAMELSPYERKYGVFNVAIHRADLLRILADETGKENIRLSKRLSKIEKHDRFRLTFEDNEVRDSDVVIGADGIKSVVRAQLFGSSMIRDTGQVCWRGVCETELPGKYHHEAYESWGRGKRFGFVKINDRKIYWYAVVNRRLATGQDNLSALFEEFHPDLLKIISGTPGESVFQSDIADLKPISRWQKENVCLVGDAAHATTPNLGQGACQAVEDAYTIGQLLKKGRSLGGIFPAYEKLRIKKAHYIVHQSRIAGNIAHWENAAGVWLRNTLMKRLPKAVNDKQLEKIFKIDNV